MKWLILIGGFLIVFVVAAGLLFFGIVFTGQIIQDIDDKEFDYEWTTAICEGNVCQDFKVTCKDGEVLEMAPLTGQVIFSDDWEDPRDRDESLCDR